MNKRERSGRGRGLAVAMLLTLHQAAARLTVSVSTVRRLTAAGLLPIIRISPRRVGIPEQAVATYRGIGWQSGRVGAATLSSSSKGERAYFDACRRGSRKPKRGSTKRASGASYSTGNSSAAGTR